MARVITNDEVKSIEEKLLSMPKPEKKKYTRKEAVGMWKSTIQKLIESGWDFEDIAVGIREASGGTANYRVSELKELFMKYQTKPAKAGRRKTPQPSAAVQETELHESCASGEQEEL